MTLVEKFDLEREYRLYCMNKKRKGIFAEIIPALYGNRKGAAAPKSPMRGIGYDKKR